MERVAPVEEKSHFDYGFQSLNPYLSGKGGASLKINVLQNAQQKCQRAGIMIISPIEASFLHFRKTMHFLWKKQRLSEYFRHDNPNRTTWKPIRMTKHFSIQNRYEDTIWRF